MAKGVVWTLLIAVVLASGSAPTAAGQAPQPKNTPALGETFVAAQKAIEARQWDAAEARAREILASPRKSPDDAYMAFSLLMEVGRARRDMPRQIEAMEGMLHSGFQPGTAQQNVLRRGLMSAHFQQRNYERAIQYANELIANGGDGEESRSILAHSYYQSKNYREAIRVFSALVAAAEKAGRKPDRNDLVALRSCYERSGDAAAAKDTLEKLVRHYPDPGTWLALQYDVKRERLDARQKLHLYRLMKATGNLKDARDIMEYVNATTQLVLPMESLEVLELGLSRNVWKEDVDRARAERYQKSARSELAALQAKLSALEREARAAPTGEQHVLLGMVLNALGNNQKAIESLRAGIAKGGLKYPDHANMLLAEALLAAGQRAEANKAFRAIKASDAVTQRIVELWVLFTSS